MHHIERVLVRCLHWVVAHRLTLCGVTLVTLAAFLAGIPRLTEGTDIVRALKRTAPLRLSTEFIDHHLTGVNSLELMLTLPEVGANPASPRSTVRGKFFAAYPPTISLTMSNFAFWPRKPV